MRYVKVQYDAYSRQLNLANAESGHDVEDISTFLMADSFVDDFLRFDQLEELVSEPRVH